jgi:plastocyanin
MRYTWRTAFLAIFLSIVFPMVAACSSGGAASSQPTASTGSATTQAASPAASKATPTVVEGNSITEVATDDKFSEPDLVIKAGQAYTLTFQNRGQAIHNWHVLGVKDASGKDIIVPLTESGQTSTITFTISKSGTYQVQCDAHPSDMKGSISVQ